MRSLKVHFLLFSILLFLTPNKIFCQQSFSKELGLISDNDLYTSTYYDRYYTNGTFLYFRYLSKKSQLKKIHEFRIGQQMYTPQFIFSLSTEDVDRPYAGYIFARYNQLLFSNKNYGIKYSFELGLLGPAARAKDLQDMIHDIYGYPPSEGWKHQIKNTVGVNMEFIFLKPFSKNEQRKIDFTSITSLRLGTIISELITNVYARINILRNPLTNYSNSTLFGSNLNSKPQKQKKELFLFLKPQIGYALYNATIQGSKFNTNSPITFGINTYIYELEGGIKYAIKRFDLSYSIIKHSKKTKAIKENTNTYGSIQIAYKFN